MYSILYIKITLLNKTVNSAAGPLEMVMPMSETSAEVQKAYNAWVHQYDTNANSTRDLNAKILRLQPFDLAGKSILEIGCGTGFNTIWLARRARFVVGVDIAEGMLRKAHRRAGALNVCVLQADITKPWVFGQAFDLIVANLVLEHILLRTFLTRHALSSVPAACFTLASCTPTSRFKERRRSIVMLRREKKYLCLPFSITSPSI